MSDKTSTPETSGTSDGPGSGNAAREAHESDTVDVIAQAGLIAFGVVHVIIGWLAVSLALGERQGGASSTGAIKQLAEQPYGKILVGLVAVGMVLLTLWKLIDAAIGYRDDDNPKRTAKRLLALGRAILYATIAATSADVALGSSSKSGGSSTDSMTASLMNRPGGQLMVAAVGVVIVVIGIAHIVMAVRESYLKKLDGEGRSGKDGKAYRVLGRVGYSAKGFALGVVGGLFLYAAATHDAKKSGGLDQALRTVLEQPFGAVLLVAIGVGFAAYGCFCFAKARHLKR